MSAAILKITSRSIYNKGSGCWEWSGSKTKGYGVLSFDGRTCRAHRLMYQETRGVKLITEQVVCHRCDNPKCVNPFHLFQGTQIENLEDCRKKGRNNIGIRNGCNILTEAQVLEIFNMKGEAQKIAKDFGVKVDAIYSIRYGKTWRWLTKTNYAPRS